VPTEVSGLTAADTATESQPDRSSAVRAAIARGHRVLDEGDSDASHNLAEPDGKLTLVSYEGAAFVVRNGLNRAGFRGGSITWIQPR
jgi:hypothetical protein